jgi:hypothetical protein
MSDRFSAHFDIPNRVNVGAIRPDYGRHTGSGDSTEDYAPSEVLELQHILLDDRLGSYL